MQQRTTGCSRGSDKIEIISIGYSREVWSLE